MFPSITQNVVYVAIFSLSFRLLTMSPYDRCRKSHGPSVLHFFYRFIWPSFTHKLLPIVPPLTQTTPHGPLSHTYCYSCPPLSQPALHGSSLTQTVRYDPFSHTDWSPCPCLSSYIRDRAFSLSRESFLKVCGRDATQLKDKCS